MANILEQIVEDKKQELVEYKQSKPLSDFIDTLVPSDRDFKGALSQSQTSFILECKKSSPSKGLIRENFDLEEITKAYRNYASAISVLTDEKYFGGRHEYLVKVRDLVSQPVLNKDFFVDEYQVYLARHIGADAILLMLSVLTDEEYVRLSQIAHEYNMDVLTEVSNEEEMDRANNLKAAIIGINNRNLRDLSTDLDTTRHLAPLAHSEAIIISESGIYNNHQTRELSNYCHGFLVGSSLMAERDLTRAVKKLVLGEHKVCGLTKADDAIAACDAGAVFGGLIFAKSSSRAVTLDEAKDVVSASQLQFVGVFVDANVSEVVETAAKLNLAAVQLHGAESQEYVDDLSSKLQGNCQIWKAIPVTDTIPAMDFDNVDRYVLDSKTPQGFGGTGETFNWQLIDEQTRSHPFMLAGGLTPENVQQALNLFPTGLDMNSGVETAPGQKSTEKVNQAFHQIREY